MRPLLDDLPCGLDPLHGEAFQFACQLGRSDHQEAPEVLFNQYMSEDHGLRIDAEYFEYFKKWKGKVLVTPGFLDRT